MIRYLWPIVFALAATACENTFESHGQRELWEKQGIRDYQFEYFVSCFCAFTGPNPALITVRNGLVAKVENVNSAGPAAGVNGWPTIDSLFVIIDRAGASRAALLDVDYDDTYHYPTSINIDLVERTADDEVTYRVQKFIPSNTAQ